MLKVFYGWTKVNKIRKNEAISVIFENCVQDANKRERFLAKMQETVYVREQTANECLAAQGQNRMYTEYSIRMDDKRIKGDLEKALEINFEADSNNVSTEERETIRQQLRNWWKMNHA